jgi:putative intracellular protease/amidase
MMHKESNNIAILVSNYFTAFQFDNALRTLSNIGHVDIISSETGKIKSWDKTAKEYHTVVLYKNKICKVNPLDYTTIIVHEDLINDRSAYVNKETISFINTFMGRMKPIIAICQNEWTVITSTKLGKAFGLVTPSQSPFKIFA